MKINYPVTAALFLLASCATYSQQAVKLAQLNVTHKASQDDSTAKDSSKNVVDFFIGGGFVTGPSDEGDKIEYGASREFIVGMGYARKLVKWNAVGIDLYYKSTGFFLTQDSSKILPNGVLHNAEKISLNNLGGVIFDRFYFGKLFLDGGFYYDWALITKHVAYDNFTVANNNGGSSTKSIDRQLVFMNDYNYGLTFRFGQVNGVALYFNYRLTNVFTKGTASNPSLFYNLPFPPFVIGLVVGTF
ncbi:MAG: hypothetical protein HKL88_04805 [Bacteroidia bacterium]|jgi:hypothetical protein|nr:hypothetical protein [Bacteroidia bacterium]